MIKISNLSKSFNDKKIISSISLTIKSSSIVLIHGISGSGKTTLLNMIAGLEQVSDGEILVDDKKVSFHDESLLKNYIYYSSVENDLIINSKLIDNLLLINSHEEFIDKLLNEFHLEKYKNKKISKLSKGERERVSLIKALLSNKKIILFDEPTANLDKENSILFIKTLNKYLNNRIVIICSHDYQLLKNYVDYLYKLENSTLISEETVNKCDFKKVAVDYKSPKKTNVFTKIALTKIFRRKLFLCFNIGFLFLLLSSTFLSVSYGMIDLDSYREDFVNQYVEDDDFLIAYATTTNFTGPFIKDLSENYKIYFDYLFASATPIPDLGSDLDEGESNTDFGSLNISVIDFDSDLRFSSEFDDSNIEDYLPVIINENQKNFIQKYYEISVEINSLIPYICDEKQLIVANIVEDYKDDLETKYAFACFPVFTSLDYALSTFDQGMSISFNQYNDLRITYINEYEDYTLPNLVKLLPFSFLEENNIDFTLFSDTLNETDFFISQSDYDLISLFDDKHLTSGNKILDFLNDVDLFENTNHPNLNSSYSLNGYFESDDYSTHIIISDDVYNKIIKNIYDGYYYIDGSNALSYVSKEFLLNNLDYLSSQYFSYYYFYVHSSELNDLVDTIDSFSAKKNMFANFSYVLFGLFVILFSVYFMLIFIDLKRDGSILFLNGYCLKDVFKVIFIYLSFIFTFGIISWVCFVPLLIYIIQIFGNPFGYYILSNVPIPIIVAFAIVVGLVLIYSTSILLIKKEKMFDIIKNT